MGDDTVGRITFGPPGGSALRLDGSGVHRLPGDEPRRLRETLEEELSEEAWAFAGPLLSTLADSLPEAKHRPAGAVICRDLVARALEELEPGGRQSDNARCRQARAFLEEALARKPRPAPTLAQLETVYAMAASLGIPNGDEVEALAVFRAYILHDDPEAPAHLAEIGPALMRLGGLVLEDYAALAVAGPPYDEGTDVPAALVAHRDAELALEAAIDEYHRRFPKPAILPALPARTPDETPPALPEE